MLLFMLIVALVLAICLISSQKCKDNGSGSEYVPLVQDTTTTLPFFNFIAYFLYGLKSL